MCKFTNYACACTHSAISYPFCANPCPRHISFANQGLRTFRDSQCPDTCLEENVLSFACKGCKDLPHFRNLPDPATAPVPTFEGVWHIPEGAAHIEHLRITDPWADDRRGDSNIETERRQRERHDERSVSPEGRSGSGVMTDQRTARDGSDMRSAPEPGSWSLGDADH
jgi:hypothetical protein